MTAMTQAEYARRRGWARSTVTRALHKGRLVKTPDGLIDVEASDTRYQATAVRPAQATGATAEATAAEGGVHGLMPSAANSRAKREHYEAEIKALEYRQRVGDLIPREDVDTVLRFVTAAVRSAMDVYPDQVAPLVAPETDLDEVHARLAEACRQVLVDIGDAIRRQHQALPQGSAS
jgi:hypothetical protein